MVDINIHEIQNGYTIYFVGKTEYYKTKKEVLKKIEELLSRNTGNQNVA